MHQPVTPAERSSVEQVRACFAACLFDPRKGGGTLRYHCYLPGFQKRQIRSEIFGSTPKASKIWPEDHDADWRELSIGRLRCLSFRLASRGFPNSILEAMVSGLTAVSTRFIGWSEELGEPGYHYLLAEHDPRSLADALAEILEKPEVRDRLATEGVRWVRKSMKLDATLDRFVALYRELAG